MNKSAERPVKISSIFNQQFEKTEAVDSSKKVPVVESSETNFVSNFSFGQFLLRLLQSLISTDLGFFF